MADDRRFSWDDKEGQTFCDWFPPRLVEILQRDFINVEWKNFIVAQRNGLKIYYLNGKEVYKEKYSLEGKALGIER